MARHLGGAGGPGGAYVNVLTDWFTRLSSKSEHLWEELSCWSSWIDNKHLLKVAIRSMMACHIVALDNAPGV